MSNSHRLPGEKCLSWRQPCPLGHVVTGMSDRKSKMTEIILPKTKEIGLDIPGPIWAGPTRLNGPTGNASFTPIARVL